MIAMGKIPVHLIFDARNLTSQPTNIKQLSATVKSVISHEAIGIIIVVTENTVQRFLGNILLQLFHKSSKIVATLEEGIEILERLDSSLPQLPKQVPLRDDVVVIENSM
jgi:hypothetical protein